MFETCAPAALFIGAVGHQKERRKEKMKKMSVKRVLLALCLIVFLVCCACVAGCFGYDAPIKVAECVTYAWVLSAWALLYLAVDVL